MADSHAKDADDPLLTSQSMLGQVQGGSADGWWQLVNQYSSLISTWAKHAGLQDSDAADVLQEVLVAVHRKIGVFKHRPHKKAFRGWLWTITRNKIQDVYRRKRVLPDATGGSSAQQRILALPQEEPRETREVESPVSDDDLAFLASVESIRGEFKPKTWQAFWRTVIDEVPGSEAAKELGITPNAVRIAKFRVLKRLRTALDEPPVD